MSSNISSKEELELIEKLNKLRGGPSPPSPPPIPFSNLSTQLKKEILITTNFLKSFLNDEGNIKSVVFSPTIILNSLATIILSLERSSSSRSKGIMEEMENIFGKNFVNNFNELNGLIFLRFLIYSKKLLLTESFKSSWSKTDNDLILPVNSNNNLDEVIKEINSNMTNKTMGKISKMFVAFSFSSLFTPEISLCLGSAATFISQWYFSFPFDEPKLGTFYSNPPRQIYMIRQKEKQLWQFSEGEDWTCMNIVYGNDVTRMLYIILPKEKDGLKQLIKKFDYSMIRECIKGADVNAIATIPIFEIGSTTVLNDKLKDMGITKLFEKHVFDKEIIDDPICNGLDLCVHNARIKVDQYGAYGRDNTADHLRFDDIRIQPGYMVPKPDCREIEFIANQPFIFFVALRSNNLQDDKIIIKSIQFAGIFS